MSSPPPLSSRYPCQRAVDNRNCAQAQNRVRPPVDSSKAVDKVARYSLYQERNSQPPRQFPQAQRNLSYKVKNQILNPQENCPVRDFSCKDIAFAMSELGKEVSGISYVSNTTIKELLRHVLKNNPKAQDIGMIVNGLGKLAQRKLLHSSQIAEYSFDLLLHLQEKCPNEQGIASNSS